MIISENTVQDAEIMTIVARRARHLNGRSFLKTDFSNNVCDPVIEVSMALN